MSSTFKYILIFTLTPVLIGAVYFASLHLSKPQVLTPEAVQLREKLQKGQVIHTDAMQGKQAKQDMPVVLKQGKFNPNAQDSDALHRGSGGISIVYFMGANRLVFAEDFHVTNGPNYYIYLLNEQGVETEQRFLKLKPRAFQLARLKQFGGYQVFELPATVKLDEVTAVLIWCEMFGQFISSADLN